MFAYGVLFARVLVIAVLESLIVGLLGTAIGVALGLALVGWVVHSVTPNTLPELGTVVSLAPASLAPRPRSSASPRSPWRRYSHCAAASDRLRPFHPACGRVGGTAQGSVTSSRTRRREGLGRLAGLPASGALK